MKQTAVLHSPQQAHVVLSALWADIKSNLMAGRKLRVKVEEGATLSAAMDLQPDVFDPV